MNSRLSYFIWRFGIKFIFIENIVFKRAGSIGSFDFCINGFTNLNEGL
jgi:hypothetical protein